MVDHTWIGGIAPRVFKHKTDAALDQAAPVQNTWYTVLNTTSNVRILAIGTAVLVADETLAVRVTIDGITLTTDFAATAATEYYLTWWLGSDLTDRLQFAAGTAPIALPLFEGHSVKIEIRKTTALGAGNLRCKVIYEVME